MTIERIVEIRRHLSRLTNDDGLVSEVCDWLVRYNVERMEMGTQLAVYQVWSDESYKLLSVLGDAIAEHTDPGDPLRAASFRACMASMARFEERMPQSAHDVAKILASPVPPPRRPITFVE